MRISSSLLLILLTGAVIISGCTQGTGTVQPAPTVSVPVTIPSLANLAVTQSDLPACFTLTEKNDKSPDDVGKMAKDLGWQAGYSVTFTCTQSDKGPTVLVHSLAVYPEASIPTLVSMVDRQDRTAGYTYRDLSFAGGAAMRGFYGTPDSDEDSGSAINTALFAGKDDRSRAGAMAEGSIAEIIFYRGNTFEVLRMTGPETNVTVLESIAARAAGKIL